MKPIQFPESNMVLNKPENMTDEECSSLPIFTGNSQCISCWELDEEELELIQKTGKIYISVFSGNTQPPICPMVISPFEESGRPDAPPPPSVKPCG